jgi:hypothetical protein
MGMQQDRPIKAAAAKGPYDRLPGEIRRIFTHHKQHFERFLWPMYVSAWKNYLLYTMDRQEVIHGFQTNIKVPIIKAFVDTMWTSVYDNALNTKVSGRKKDSHKTAQSMKNFLDWCFSVSNSRPQFMEAAKESMLTGIGFLKTGFVSEERILEFKKGLKKMQASYIDERPYIKYVSQFDMFYDPSAKSFRESPYKIERKIMFQDQILEQYGTIVGREALRKGMVDAAKNPFYVFMHDFNRVKWMSFWNRARLDSYPDSAVTFDTAYTRDFDISWKNNLTIDYAGGNMEVLEYWEANRFVLLLNGRIVCDDINPLPIRNDPFSALCYNKVPGLVAGHGIGTGLEGIQEVADTIYNMALDNIKLQVAPMFQKARGGDAFMDGETHLRFDPFKIVETNAPDALSRLDLGMPDFSGTQMVQNLMSMAEQSEGVNAYAQGAQGKVERSATGVSALVQAFKARLLPFVDSMNQALAEIAENLSGIAVAIFKDEIEVKVSDPKDGGVSFKKIKLEDLMPKYDVEFDAQALKTATREIRRAQLTQLMQTAAQSGVDPMTGEAFINMRALWREYLDCYEMPSQDIVLAPKEVADYKAKAQDDAAKVQQKWQDKRQEAADAGRGPGGSAFQPQGGGFQGNTAGQPLPFAPGGAMRKGFPAPFKTEPGQNPDQTIPQEIPQSIPQSIDTGSVLKETYQRKD